MGIFFSLIFFRMTFNRKDTKSHIKQTWAKVSPLVHITEESRVLLALVTMWFRTKTQGLISLFFYPLDAPHLGWLYSQTYDSSWCQTLPSSQLQTEPSREEPLLPKLLQNPETVSGWSSLGHVPTSVPMMWPWEWDMLIGLDWDGAPPTDLIQRKGDHQMGHEGRKDNGCWEA